MKTDCKSSYQCKLYSLLANTSDHSEICEGNELERPALPERTVQVEVGSEELHTVVADRVHCQAAQTAGVQIEVVRRDREAVCP